jgi:hypothetical protein
MIKNPFAGFDFSNPFGTDAMKRSRNLFGVHTTPRDWKHGARDIPFGLGAQSLYVDGTDGDDSNDGESWLTAKKTIQAAIDAASHWTNIFIKPGAYAEAAQVDSKHSISLLGATRAGVHITAPSGGNEFTSSAVSFKDALGGYVANLKLTGGTDYYGVYGSNADLLRIENCHCYGCSDGIRLYSTDDAVICNNIIDGNNLNIAVTHAGIYIDPASSRSHTYQNTISNYTGSGNGAYLGDESRFHNNTIESVPRGIMLTSIVTSATIFHNNIITCSLGNITDASTNAEIFENYYSSHSNVDNGFGIAKAPYAYTGGTDPRPICVRNGWLGLSWADADLVALASVCTETRLAELAAANLPADIDAIKSRNVSMMEFWSDLDASVALSTSTTNVALPNVIVAGIPSGATIIRAIGMLHQRHTVDTSGAINGLAAAAVVNVKKSTGAWGTDDVALINFPANTWYTAASSRSDGRLFVGDNDAASEVDGNATYNLRFNGNAYAKGFVLAFIDIAVGLQVYFTA